MLTEREMAKIARDIYYKILRESLAAAGRDTQKKIAWREGAKPKDVLNALTPVVQSLTTLTRSEVARVGRKLKERRRG